MRFPRVRRPKIAEGSIRYGGRTRSVISEKLGRTGSDRSYLAFGLFLFLFLLLLVSRVSIHAGADAIHGVGAGTFRLSGLRDCGPCSRWRAGCVIRLALRPSSAIGRHRCRAVGTCLRFLTFREFLVSLGKQVQAICGSACCIVGADVSSIIVLIRCD